MARSASLTSATTVAAPEKITETDVAGLTRYAQKAIRASRAPAVELQVFSRELDALRDLAEPSAKKAIDRFEHLEGILALFHREASLGRSTASALRKELTRSGGIRLIQLGSPYHAMVRTSLRWGDEEGGTIHVGFDAKRLPRAASLNGLNRAMENFADVLARNDVNAETVELARQRYAAFFV